MVGIRKVAAPLWYQEILTFCDDELFRSTRCFFQSSHLISVGVELVIF